MLTATFVVVLLLGLNALFVAAEFAAVAARRHRVKSAADSGQRSAKMLLAVVLDPLRLDRYISCCQLGITVTSLGMGAYGQQALANSLRMYIPDWITQQEVAAQSISITVVLIGLSALQVVLGEQVPKSFALHKPDAVGFSTVRLVLLSQRMLAPLITFLNGTSRMFLRLIGAPLTMHEHVHSRQEIDMLINQSESVGVLEAGQHQRLQHALELEVLTAEQLMIPRPEIAAVDIEHEGEEVLQEILDGRFTRLPVYRESIDNIIGILHTKDLARQAVAEGKIKGWKRLVRPVFFVNEGMTADRLISKLRQKQTQQAIVMDEFGGVAGLVTLEDILTHVFGQVADEFSGEGQAKPEPLPDGRIRLPGRLRLDEVVDWIGQPWTGSANTAGGHVTQILGHLPEEGELLNVDGAQVTVERMENNVVASLLVLPPNPESEEEGDG